MRDLSKALLITVVNLCTALENLDQSISTKPLTSKTPPSLTKLSKHSGKLHGTLSPQIPLQELVYSASSGSFAHLITIPKPKSITSPWIAQLPLFPEGRFLPSGSESIIPTVESASSQVVKETAKDIPKLSPTVIRRKLPPEKAVKLASLQNTTPSPMNQSDIPDLASLPSSTLWQLISALVQNVTSPADIASAIASTITVSSPQSVTTPPAVLPSSWIANLPIFPESTNQLASTTETKSLNFEITIQAPATEMPVILEPSPPLESVSSWTTDGSVTVTPLRLSTTHLLSTKLKQYPQLIESSTEPTVSTYTTSASQLETKSYSIQTSKSLITNKPSLSETKLQLNGPATVTSMLSSSSDDNLKPSTIAANIIQLNTMSPLLATFQTGTVTSETPLTQMSPSHIPITESILLRTTPHNILSSAPSSAHSSFEKPRSFLKSQWIPRLPLFSENSVRRPKHHQVSSSDLSKSSTLSTVQNEQVSTTPSSEPSVPLLQKVPQKEIVMLETTLQPIMPTTVEPELSVTDMDTTVMSVKPPSILDTTINYVAPPTLTETNIISSSVLDTTVQPVMSTIVSGTTVNPEIPATVMNTSVTSPYIIGTTVIYVTPPTLQETTLIDTTLQLEMSTTTLDSTIGPETPATTIDTTAILVTSPSILDTTINYVAPPTLSETTVISPSVLDTTVQPIISTSISKQVEPETLVTLVNTTTISITSPSTTESLANYVTQNILPQTTVMPPIVSDTTSQPDLSTSISGSTIEPEVPATVTDTTLISITSPSIIETTLIYVAPPTVQETAVIDTTVQPAILTTILDSTIEPEKPATAIDTAAMSLTSSSILDTTKNYVTPAVLQETTIISPAALDTIVQPAMSTTILDLAVEPVTPATVVETTAMSITSPSSTITISNHVTPTILSETTVMLPIVSDTTSQLDMSTSISASTVKTEVPATVTDTTLMSVTTPILDTSIQPVTSATLSDTTAEITTSAFILDTKLILPAALNTTVSPVMSAPLSDTATITLISNTSVVQVASDLMSNATLKPLAANVSLDPTEESLYSALTSGPKTEQVTTVLRSDAIKPLSSDIIEDTIVKSVTSSFPSDIIEPVTSPIVSNIIVEAVTSTVTSTTLETSETSRLTSSTIEGSIKESDNKDIDSLLTTISTTTELPKLSSVTNKNSSDGDRTISKPPSSRPPGRTKLICKKRKSSKKKKKPRRKCRKTRNQRQGTGSTQASVHAQRSTKGSNHDSMN